MKKYKYIHIFQHNDLKFNPRVIKLINDPNNNFNKDEHFFVTPHKRVYDEIKSYDNVVLDERKKLINKYGKYADWIITHSLICNEVYSIRNKYLKKVIWRTWGHDTALLEYKKKSYIKNTVKYLLNAVHIGKVRSFAAVGIANAVDAIDIKKKFGDVPTYKISYSEKGNYEAILKAKNSQKKEDCLSVLLGHSGHFFDNHINLLKSLKKFSNENIRIYVMLSYGDNTYIEGVENYIKNNCTNKVVIINEMMKYEEYIDFLSKMDVAILDGKVSYALGNIGVLLTLNKKIFLNRDGVIREVFDYEGQPYCCTDEIDNMTFEDFGKPLVYTEGNDGLMTHDYSYGVNNWKILLEHFN